LGQRGPVRTFGDVLLKLREECDSDAERGIKFENVMLEFFKTDRYYSGKFSKVYKWNAWPGNEGERDTGVDLVAIGKNGERYAIQCKFYGDSTVLGWDEMAKFVGTASTHKLDSLILVWTGTSITSTARSKLEKMKCSILDRETLEKANVDWSRMPRLAAKDPKRLRDYQKAALEDVLEGFEGSSRGKLVMACGTGKTLVALHVAESTVGEGGTVLYLVPSISLIGQSMREWSNNAGIEHYYVAVCSDRTVGEEGSVLELECPVSTDAASLRENVGRRPRGAMTVVFSTYHSVRVASRALAGRFDLVLCDEAHRTTGIESDSHYTYVHSDRNVPARRRLYMTATPKIYGEAVKGAARGRAAERKKAGAGNGEGPAIYSMDDEATYGPEFHRLGFVDAVHKHGALADFRVIIPMVSTRYVDKEFQQAVSDGGAMPLDERTLLAAVWHGIQYPRGEKEPMLLQRVITFTNRIDRSEMFAGAMDDETKKRKSFRSVVGELKEKRPTRNDVEVRHIDGRKNALARRREMRWLAESEGDRGVCRILSNARCLSEGVDVPALDGVVFLNPRESIVDIVQSVGRVMRRAKGKETGYVILPVAIPAGFDVNSALDSHPSYRTVWQVLNALRSHDESLAREINSLILDKKEGESGGDVTERISFSILGIEDSEKLSLPALFDKIKSTLIRKVGDADYYDEYGRRIGDAAATVEMRIKHILEASSTKKRELDKFHESLKLVINDQVTRDEAIKVIAQHVVLARVFDTLFSGEFTSYNPISKVLSDMSNSFGLGEELKELEGFYTDVENEVREIKSPEARQNFIKTVYGNFFKSTTKKETEKYGVVFTPVELVDFVINSVQYLLQSRFKIGFSDRKVKVLEPFAGTGTFITRLLDSGYLGKNTYQKYKSDLFANEMILLAYYVATVNIETTYSSKNGNRYVPFGGISYTDTLRQNPRYLQSSEHKQEQTAITGVFQAVHEQIRRQRETNVDVIIGNPPYSAKQGKYDDSNPNTKYPQIDQRISDTYLKKANAHNKNSLYDSYIRALRWASDRIGRSGIVAFVTNASFIRSEVASGIRASLIEEFDEIWCFDLRGNQRTQGEASQKEGGKIFGSGSRAPVSITILVRLPNQYKKEKLGTLRYKDIGNYLTREEKINIIKNIKTIQNIKDWEIIIPDKHNDWIGQRNASFDSYIPIGSKEAKAGKTNAVFRMYSRGVTTNRDVWAYNSQSEILGENMKRHIEYCNMQDLSCLKINKQKAQWSQDLKTKLKKIKPKFDQKNIRCALYRPWFKQYLYFDKTYNGALHKIPLMFPDNSSENLVICFPYKVFGKFSALVTNLTPDLNILQANQCFPLYIYDSKGNKMSNITDETLQEFVSHYDKKSINKRDVFNYVYGILHNVKYLKTFEYNLSKEHPRIPLAPNFEQFQNIGKKLIELHTKFENCDRVKLGKPIEKFGKPHKISFGRKGMKVDKTKIRINGILVFENIPQSKYHVNGRTPLEWVVDRYNRTIDKDSGIVNNPLEDMDEDDIIAVIERAVYVGLETDRLIAELPDEFEPKNWKPKKAGLDAHIDE